MVSQRILAVDDSGFSLRVLTTVLKKAGFDVETAMTGQEALEKARTVKPALVFLDAVLPDMSGFDVARRMKEDPTLTPSPYVVLLTGLEDAAEEGHRNEGIDEVVTKPFQPQQLIDIVQRVLRT